MSRLVIVTGASSGIGRATVLVLAERGISTVAVARRFQLLETLAQEADALGSLCLPISCDVSDRQECQKVVEKLRQDYSESELALVNCAGTSVFGNLAEMDWNLVSQQITVNMIGSLAPIHAFLPWMLAQQKGQIINVLSISSVHPFGGAVPYGAAKAGMLMATKCLAQEVRRQGVRVTALLPGSTDTPLWDQLSWSPEKSDMLSPLAVAETIADLIQMPSDRSVDELLLMPPKGIL